MLIREVVQSIFRGRKRQGCADSSSKFFFQVKIEKFYVTTLKKGSNKFNEDCSLKWISKFGRNDFEQSENIFRAIDV